MGKDINIEKIYNEQLGFEDDVEGYENEDGVIEETDEQPFNAESIRIDQQMLSLKYIYELYQDGVLKLNPDFQRQYVWKQGKRKSMLIESLMLRIPIPAFYFFEKKDGSFLVIDGQQRLRTIFDFLDGKFSLYGMEYLGEEYDKKKFDDLDPKYQQRIRRTQLAINILDERSPQKVVYDIFRRVNSGGMPLNPQEMRNAICSDNVREFLKQGASSKSFNVATRGKINPLRLDDQEIFLRYITIYRRYDYNSQSLLKLSPTKLLYLMDQEVFELDTLSKSEQNALLQSFEISMKRCYELFGNYAFINIRTDKNNTTKYANIINKPLLIAFSVLLSNSEFSNIDFIQFSERAINAITEQLKDISYQNSISKATGDERNIKICLENSLEVLKKCGIISQK
jgi:hypothetical protein